MKRHKLFLIIVGASMVIMVLANYFSHYPTSVQMTFSHLNFPGPRESFSK